MPPLKSSSRHISNVPATLAHDDNHYVVNLAASNDNKTQFTCCKYAPKVLNNLNSLRRDSRFCDVDIIAGGTVIKVSIYTHSDNNNNN